MEGAQLNRIGDSVMGQFVNPGNDNFEKEIHSKIYVDFLP